MPHHRSALTLAMCHLRIEGRICGPSRSIRGAPHPRRKEGARRNECETVALLLCTRQPNMDRVEGLFAGAWAHSLEFANQLIRVSPSNLDGPPSREQVPN